MSNNKSIEMIEERKKRKEKTSIDVKSHIILQKYNSIHFDSIYMVILT